MRHGRGAAQKRYKTQAIVALQLCAFVAREKQMKTSTFDHGHFLTHKNMHSLLNFLMTHV
jgi:hypothetical protein